MDDKKKNLVENTIINIDEPKYDQSTYIGRAKHFFLTTNPLNLLASNELLENSKNLVEFYRQHKILPSNITENDLWKAKYLMESAYHPDTKEKMAFFGRMSAQLPGNLIITVGMLTWYKTTSGVLFWQTINQSFNALVNYTNRSGDSKDASKTRLGGSFLLAVSSATLVSIFLNSVTRKMPPIFGRFVPFTAVAAANFVNIPFMRSSELEKGISVVNINGDNVGLSKKAAQIAISEVVLSRVLMAIPSMLIGPITLILLERKYTKIRKSLKLTIGFQLAINFVALIFATPLCCAIYPQKSQLQVDKLETCLKNELLKKGYKTNDYVYFNKGL